ncbi:hypothetical protein Tco_1183585 [Tanacetum coccineum]
METKGTKSAKCKTPSLVNTMAEQNVPAQPPTRTDEQIVPRSQCIRVNICVSTLEGNSIVAQNSASERLLQDKPDTSSANAMGIVTQTKVRSCRTEYGKEFTKGYRTFFSHKAKPQSQSERTQRRKKLESGKPAFQLVDEDRWKSTRIYSSREDDDPDLDLDLESQGRAPVGGSGRSWIPVSEATPKLHEVVGKEGRCVIILLLTFDNWTSSQPDDDTSENRDHESLFHHVSSSKPSLLVTPHQSTRKLQQSSHLSLKSLHYRLSAKSGRLEKDKYSVLPGPESVKNQESEKSPKEIINPKRNRVLSSGNMNKIKVCKQEILPTTVIPCFLWKLLEQMKMPWYKELQNKITDTREAGVDSSMHRSDPESEHSEQSSDDISKQDEGNDSDMEDTDNASHPWWSPGKRERAYDISAVMAHSLVVYGGKEFSINNTPDITSKKTIPSSTSQSSWSRAEEMIKEKMMRLYDASKFCDGTVDKSMEKQDHMV